MKNKKMRKTIDINDYFLVRCVLTKIESQTIYVQAGLYRKDANIRVCSLKNLPQGETDLTTIAAAIEEQAELAATHYGRPEDWGSKPLKLLNDFMRYKNEKFVLLNDVEAVLDGMGNSMGINRAFDYIEDSCISFIKQINSLSIDEQITLIGVTDKEVKRYETSKWFDVDTLTARTELYRFINEPSSEVEQAFKRLLAFRDLIGSEGCA